LQEDEVAFPSEVRGHLHEDFPVESLLVEANAAPKRNVLKNLIRDRIDRALRFAGAGASGDEPASHEVLHRPREAGEPENGLGHDIRGEKRP
jgi:hypothetical protein